MVARFITMHISADQTFFRNILIMFIVLLRQMHGEQFIQFLHQIRCNFMYMIYNLILLENIKYCADCSSYKRISTISCSVITGCQRFICHLLSHKKCTHRHTTAKCFCNSHNIRFHTIILPCKHCTGTSHTTLNFIQDQ